MTDLLVPLNNITTEQLASVWSKEFKRTTGKNVTVTLHSRVSYTVCHEGSYGTRILRRKDFLSAIEKLKARPDFIPKTTTQPMPKSLPIPTH